MSHPKYRTLSTFCAALAALALVAGGNLAAKATGDNLPDHQQTAAAPSSVLDEAALVEVTGTVMMLADLPADAPDLFITLDSGLAVPIDRQSLPEEISPAQSVTATVVVPAVVVAEASPEVTAELSADNAADDDGSQDPLDGNQGAGEALIEAAAAVDLALEVAELEVLAEAPVALAGEPAPHWVDIAFLSANDRGKFISEADMAVFMGALSDWWARETKGEIPSFNYSYAQARAGKTAAQCVTSANGAFREGAALFGVSDSTVYIGSTRRHLLVLSPSDENVYGVCAADYAGVATRGSWGLASGGQTHLVVSNGLSSRGTLIHEIGHHLSLVHSASATCPEGVVDGPVGPSDQQICTGDEIREIYGDTRSVQGNSSSWETSGLNGWQKTRLGILDATVPTLQVIETSGVHDVVLKDNAQAQGPGIEALKILETRGSSISEYWVEFDSRAGGVAIRHIDRRDDASLSSFYNDRDSYVLTPGGSHPNMSQRWMAGQTMESVGGGLTVRIDQAAAGQARVHVELALSNPWVRVARSRLMVDEPGYPGATVVTTSGGSWSATSDSAWLVPTASGTSGQTLTASVAANPTAELRSGTITVRSSTASAKILVLQGPPRPRISLSQASWAAEAAISSIGITVTTKSSEPWTASSNQSWLSILSPTGASGQRTVLYAQANTGPVRSATVTVASGGDSVTLPVTQPAADTTLKLSGSGLGALAFATSIDVTVTTNQPSWSASSDLSWLTVSPSSGLPGGKLTVYVAANTSPLHRAGTATVVAGGKEVTFSVTQTPAELVSVSQTEWSPGTDASDLSVMVRSTTGYWNATSNQSWLTISSRNGMSGDLLALSVTPYAGAARRGTVTLMSGGAPATITVVQGEVQATLSTSVSAWSAWGAAASTTVQVATNQPSWSASSNQSWLTVAPTSGSSGGSATVSVAANTSSSSRSGTVTFTAGGASSTVVVTQAAGATTAPSVSLSVAQWAPRGEASQIPVAVTTNQTSWSASSNQSWLTISPSSGGDGATMTVSTSANTSSSSRSGVVTVTAGSASATLSVTQAAGAQTAVSVSIPSWSVWAGAVSTGVVVTTSQGSWSASSNQSWLTVSPSSGANGASATVSVTANASVVARSGIVTFSAGGASATMTVNQEGDSDASERCNTFQAACLWDLSPVVVAPVGTTNHYLRFTAPTSGTWVFESSARASTSDPYGFLFDAGFSLITQNDDDAGNLNFRLQATLTAGRVYYLAASQYLTTKSGQYTITARETVPTASVSLSQTSWAPSSALGSSSVVVTTNQASWSAVPNQSWISVAPSSGASGATLTVSVSANTGAARSGSVTVSAGSASVTFAVNQAAAPQVITPPPGCGAAYATACAWNLVPIRVTPGPTGTALKFTAPTTGVYVFESSDRTVNSNPFGVVASSGGQGIAFDDDSAGNSHFRISVTLVAGQFYYLTGLDRGTPGSFTITARLPG